MIGFSLMEKAAMLRHIEALRNLAIRGEGLIEAQRRIVAALAASGSNTAAARKVLDTLENTHKAQLAEIEQVSKLLGEADET
jgi:hypothetical protein